MTTRETAMPLCLPESSQLLLALEPQPISNRFRASVSEPEAKFPITLSQCQTSGLLYLSQSVPQRELVPRVDWLTYNEPEAHLDQMVETLAKVCEIAPGDIAGGISSKDDTTLDRFRTLECETWRLDLERDLEIVQPGVGVESIQRELSPEVAKAAAHRHRPASVLVVRHILEHVYDLPRFFAALKSLVRPGGYIVLEVPDCARALDNLDYTTIWEEHLYYFTEFTLRRVLRDLGMPVVFFESYPYPFENSLVAVLKNEDGPATLSDDGELVKRELKRGQRFASSFVPERDRAQSALREAARRGPVAVFGAGHLTSTYLSLFGLEQYCSFVIDDNPHKANTLLPGTALPVRPSSTLGTDPLSLCLLGLNPMNEDRVVERFTGAVARAGGEFRSIFPASSRYLLRGDL